MTTGLAERPSVKASEADSDGRGWSRPQILVILERPNPSPWSLRQVVRFAGRLAAEVFVVAVATYDREPDDSAQLKFRIATDRVQQVKARFVELGAVASGDVCLVRHGEGVLRASDLADRLHANVVLVLARGGSCYRLFPGAPLTEQLMWRRRRLVVVIPDREPPERWSGILSRLVPSPAPEETQTHGVHTCPGKLA